MISMTKIQELGQRIGRYFQPEKVMLFGSHARGEAGEDSDVDLLVVLGSEGQSIQKAVEIRLSLDHAIPIDVLVRTPEEIARRRSIGDMLIREILEKGVVLYERNCS
jgi:uncharacterized protein